MALQFRVAMVVATFNGFYEVLIFIFMIVLIAIQDSLEAIFIECRLVFRWKSLSSTFFKYLDYKIERPTDRSFGFLML